MMGRSPQAFHRIARAVATLSLALTLASCASGGAAASGSSSFSYGYMVPGERVGTAIAVRPTDTLPELSASRNLPQGLMTAIAQEVQQGNWNDRCTRRFGGPTNYAVIFHRVCDASAGPEAEPMVVVGFSSDGRKTGTVRWSGAGTVSALVPARRF